MASSTRQDWSDEDEDNNITQIETSVFLGIPDGPVESASDLNDAAVSRIGGLPTLLSRQVPFDSSRCQRCKNPMELLVQLWAPFENSPYDRVAYVWGCARSGCQRKSGSIRAWRGLRYNEKYASTLERKLAGKRYSERAPTAPLEGDKFSHQDVNPFAMSSTELARAPPSSLGSDVFNSVTPLGSDDAITSQDSMHDEDSTQSDDDNVSSSSSASSVVVALACATLADSSWQSAPSYRPQYLSTAGEYLPPSNKTPEDPTAGIVDDGAFNQEGRSWAAEKYENSMHTDHVFDRFNERTAHEPQQCVRYDLGGIPIPFASDDLYKQLFPFLPEKSGLTTITTAALNAQHPPPKRGYDAGTIPSCSHCGSRRIFEYQLMPNLINLLGKDSSTGGEAIATTDEQRKESVKQLLNGGPNVRGMEWGTILVFCCEKDCYPGGDKEKQGTWAEEVVLVHWDD
ncbi:programmed cell death protein 2 [Russula earlei]|uniref:Programmed cell death protein 2 n=1 Tax=Russula earlei TaxID=71964 RepID=A0ACC0UJM8_9AGAM|nr:programmed cell death protein 2 [Russula earlei]